MNMDTYQKQIQQNQQELEKASVVTIVIIILSIVLFLSVWIAGLVRMRNACPDQSPNAYWIATLILGIIPSGLTQLIAFCMSIYGIAVPNVGCP